MSQVPIRKSYDFKSVGRLETEFQASLTDSSAEIPIGFKTPMDMRTVGCSGPFKMRVDLAAQIKDNFRNMIATNHGDRVMLHDFGANLAELAFELGNENTDVVAVNRIRRTTEKYMPFIQLQTFEPIKQLDKAAAGLALIGVRIIYSVPSLRVRDQGVEVIIYTAG